MSGAKPTAVMPTYSRIPISFEKGQGCYLFDRDGNKYLDAISGIAVCALGHAHPAFTDAICEQAGKLVHTSNLYEIPLQTELAEKLCNVANMEQVFFCNSGAEANEAAIKLARKYGHQKGKSLPTIMVMEGAFHGRTMGALSATHNAKHQEGFQPLLEGFIRVPFNDIKAARKALQDNDQIVAVLLETVQGEGGVNTAGDSFIPDIAELCNDNELLLMLDEVQTGNGRTGKYFSYQHFASVQPDVVTTAKGLGNGFPIGAIMTAAKAASIFEPGNHGSTFGGSPLACAAGLAVYRTITDQGLDNNAAAIGKSMLESFQASLQDCDSVVDIRGLGLMIGIELDQPCSELVSKAMEHGLLLNVASGKVIRLLPPLIISAEEAAFIVDTVVQLVREF